jgi:cytochrome b
MHDLNKQPTRVWDLPTRIFHWALALTVLVSVVTAEVGGAAMAWHLKSGCVVLGLLMFRVLWGLVGGRWSRFASFLYAPSTLLRYLRGQGRPAEHLEVGHNPLGALSVLAMLAVLLAQVGTGLLADDEIAYTGPLNRLVSNATGLLATGWHKNWGRWLLLALVALHVVAIFVYLRRKQNLILPMLLGDKNLPRGTPASADGPPQRILALVLALGCTAFVVWLMGLGG